MSTSSNPGPLHPESEEDKEVEKNLQCEEDPVSAEDADFAGNDGGF